MSLAPRSPTLAAIFMLVATIGKQSTAAEELPPERTVRIHLRGREAVGVIVAVGTTLPCDSSNNERLYRGRIEGGATIDLESDAFWVCLAQTSAPFVDAGFNEGRLYWRNHCPRKGKAPPDPKCLAERKPLLIEIDSRLR